MSSVVKLLRAAGPSFKPVRWVDDCSWHGSMFAQEIVPRIISNELQGRVKRLLRSVTPICTHAELQSLLKLARLSPSTFVALSSVVTTTLLFAAQTLTRSGVSGVRGGSGAGQSARGAQSPRGGPAAAGMSDVAASTLGVTILAAA